MQITLGSSGQGEHVGVSNPWTQYVKLLPNSVPVPTMWTEEERVLLMGTSLEVCLYFSLRLIFGSLSNQSAFPSLQQSLYLREAFHR
jgi:hypothetical protein